MREFTVILRATPEFEAETSTTPYIKLVKANGGLHAVLVAMEDAELRASEVHSAIVFADHHHDVEMLG